MRDYAIFRPTFWTGETGRRIRALGQDAQLIAAYLITCPSANMIGLYYLPLVTLCHETGSPMEGALQALRSLGDLGFAHYDAASEHVFVPEMAAQQIGGKLAKSDKRCKGIFKEWQAMRKSPFYKDFHARYKDAFHLPEIEDSRSPLQAPCKPHRSQEQEQEQEQDINTPSLARAGTQAREPAETTPELDDPPPSQAPATTRPTPLKTWTTPKDLTPRLIAAIDRWQAFQVARNGRPDPDARTELAVSRRLSAGLTQDLIVDGIEMAIDKDAKNWLDPRVDFQKQAHASRAATTAAAANSP
ncbi:MAG: hypothetical protein IPJ01_12135 [Micavibrio sp.]|nr:hypothetical protein [Micavibrio sp.]